jgi:hypothetical protein
MRLTHEFIQRAWLWKAMGYEQAACEGCGKPTDVRFAAIKKELIAQPPLCSLKCFGTFHDSRANLTGSVAHAEVTETSIGEHWAMWNWYKSKIPAEQAPGTHAMTRGPAEWLALYDAERRPVAALTFTQFGAIQVTSDPDRKGENAGVALMREVARRHKLDLSAQLRTPSGVKATYKALRWQM